MRILWALRDERVSLLHGPQACPVRRCISGFRPFASRLLPEIRLRVVDGGVPCARSFSSETGPAMSSRGSQSHRSAGGHVCANPGAVDAVAHGPWHATACGWLGGAPRPVRPGPTSALPTSFGTTLLRARSQPASLTTTSSLPARSVPRHVRADVEEGLGEGRPSCHPLQRLRDPLQAPLVLHAVHPDLPQGDGLSFGRLALVRLLRGVGPPALVRARIGMPTAPQGTIWQPDLTRPRFALGPVSSARTASGWYRAPSTPAPRAAPTAVTSTRRLVRSPWPATRRPSHGPWR